MRLSGHRKQGRTEKDHQRTHESGIFKKGTKGGRQDDTNQGRQFREKRKTTGGLHHPASTYGAAIRQRRDVPEKQEELKRCHWGSGKGGSKETRRATVPSKRGRDSKKSPNRTGKMDPLITDLMGKKRGTRQKVLKKSSEWGSRRTNPLQFMTQKGKNTKRKKTPFCW